MSELTWIEIKISAFRNNLQEFHKLLKPQTQLLTVVKSNAYGHGLVEMARLAVEYGSGWLGVVNLDEALKLRAAKIEAPILVLSFWQKETVLVSEAIKQKVSLVVYDYEQLDFLNNLAEELNLKARVHLKFDVGTTRLGVLPSQAEEFLGRAYRAPYLSVEAIFSHLASSEEDQDFTLQQKKSLDEIIVLAQEIARAEKNNLPLVHLACSAAGMLGQDFQYDLVRLGVAAYGLWPSTTIYEKMKVGQKSFDLQPVLSWKTQIIQVKTVPAGTFVGYGGTFKTEHETQIAVLPVGYFDGVDRGLSNCGEFLVRGKKCPIIGRVCMNLTMLDVTEIKDLRASETVTLIGEQDGAVISADDWARWLNTINYEIVARINPEIKRRYL